MSSLATGNLAVYDSRQVAEHYAALSYLTACERRMFRAHIAEGSAVLEIGAGGGRVSGYLAQRASRYVGVDYAPKMVQTCRERHPELDFRQADASDLSSFPDGTFDSVVMAFNTIDYLPEASRARCLQEVRRVLKPGGRLIFSSHNPRAVLAPPAWNRQRVRRMASRIAGDHAFANGVAYAGLSGLRAAWAFVQAFAASAGRIFRRGTRGAFWRGEGYMLDPVHGGLQTHYWTPKRCSGELASHGFELIEVMADDPLGPAHILVTNWYYYAFRLAR